MIGARVGIFSGKGGFDFGNCLQFDGVNDYVSFSLVTAPNKMSFWIYPTRFSDCILGNSGNSSTALRITSATNIRIVFGSDVIFPASTIVLNQWNHIYLYQSGTIVKGVANGVLSTTNPTTSFQNYNQMGNYFTGGLYLSGKMDEMALSSGTGSDTEGLNLWNSGTGASIADFFTPANILFYYNFNESGGTTLTDGGLAGRNGTLNNFTGTYFIPH